MSQHTPGPWRVGSHGPNGCYTVGTPQGLMVAMVAHSVNYPDQKEQAIGDARLIAAAPDLLEALELMMQAYEANLPDHCNADRFDDYNKAATAVKKAKGIAP